MFDFRYHALSLVAVFVALAIGLLLGIAIGDQGLVSSAEQTLRDDLRSDVREAQAESAGLREELERRTRYEELTLPGLIGTRLSRRRVDLLFLQERSEPTFDHVRDAVEKAGGGLGLVGALTAPPDLEALAEAAEGTQFAGVAEDPGLLDDLGRRLGSQMIRGGRLLRAVRGRLISGSSGTAGPASALVLVGTATEGLEGEELERMDQLVTGLIDGVTAAGGIVAGVEESATSPSRIPWYREHDLPSVDNIDEVPGMASLAVVLAGEADGAYGIKVTRDAYVPEALVTFP